MADVVVVISDMLWSSRTNRKSAISELLGQIKERAYMISIGLLLFSAVLWVISSFQAKVALSNSMDVIGDLGLFSLLPPAFFLAFSMLILSFVFVLVSYKKLGKNVKFLLLCQSVLLILIVNLTPVLIEGTARFATGYSNFQAVDYISKMGHFDSTDLWILNWPSFSVFISIFSQLTSFSPSIILMLYPTVFNLLFFLGLFIFFRSVFDQGKMVWLAIWFVFLGNWVGQDYFSMQSMGLLFVVFLLFLLFRTMKNELRTHHWIVLFSVFFFYTVSSHVLSSLMITGAVFTLYLAKYHRRTILLFSSAVMLVAWTVFGAFDYLSKSLFSTLEAMLNPFDTLLTNLFNRASTGSATHVLASNIRIGYSGLIVSIALTCIIVLLVSQSFKRTEKTFFTIMLGFSMFVIFAYGGEIFMRLYMFLLIPLAYFVAKVLLTHRRLFITCFLVLIIVAPSLLMVSHYGNEQMDFRRESELHGIGFFFDSVTGGTVYGLLNHYRYEPNFTLGSLSQISELHWVVPLSGRAGHVKPYFICVSELSVQYYAFFRDVSFLTSLDENISRAPFINKVYSAPFVAIYDSK